MPDRALSFLDRLWPAGLPPSGHLVIAHKIPGNMSVEFFDDTGRAAARASELGVRFDTYVGMAAQPRLPKGRGTTKSALAIPGLWLDLDFDKGFRDVASVLRFVEALPLPPTLLVATGGGVHAHWLFKEYLEAGDDATAGSLELGWLHYCREVARLELKAQLDAVADLARVMRIPGTLNHKREPPLEVVIIQDSGQLYNPSDFENWKAEAKSGSSSSSLASFDFHLREDAQPPFDKWHIAVTNQPEVEATYNHRVKMPVDPSISGYDLGLATRLDILGWTAQEVVDTLIAHRRKWSGEITDKERLKDPLHLKDRSYYERILRKARASNESARMSAEVVQLAEEVTDEISAHGSSKPEPSTRTRWFLAVSGMLGVEVVDLWAVDSFEGSWNVRIMHGGKMRDVPTSPSKLLDWSYWINLILQSQVPVDNLPPKPPQAFRGLMLKSGMVLRVVGTDQSATNKDYLLRYLLETAESAHPYEEAAILDGQTFTRLDAGQLGVRDWGQPELCLFIRPGVVMLDARVGKCPPLSDPSKELVGLGFKLRQVAAERHGGESTSRQYYCYPVERLRSTWSNLIAEHRAEGAANEDEAVQ